MTVALIAIILSIIAVIFIRKDYSIKLAIKKRARANNIDEYNPELEKMLQEFNNLTTLFEKDYFTVSDENTNEKLKVLILGNSIAIHDKLPEIGWDNNCGMAASCEKKDYANILLEKISKLKKCSVLGKVVNLANFERNFEKLSLEKFSKFKEFLPEIIIFQLGENVPSKKIDKLEKSYESLINYFDNDNLIKIVTKPFFPDMKKNKIVDKVCLNTGSFCADLSSLCLLDNKTTLKNDRDSLTHSRILNRKSEGLLRHPGDYGMEKIAIIIFNIIKSVYKIKEEQWNKN